MHLSPPASPLIEGGWCRRLTFPFPMSYRCEICGKQPSYGRTVSFSHKRNHRRWLPNIQKIRVVHGSNTRRARVCAACIRAGKVEKA